MCVGVAYMRPALIPHQMGRIYAAPTPRICNGGTRQTYRAAPAALSHGWSLIRLPSFRRKPESIFTPFAFRQGSRASAGNETPSFMRPHPQMDSGFRRNDGEHARLGGASLSPLWTFSTIPIRGVGGGTPLPRDFSTAPPRGNGCQVLWNGEMIVGALQEGNGSVGTGRDLSDLVWLVIPAHAGIQGLPLYFIF